MHNPDTKDAGARVVYKPAKGFFYVEIRNEHGDPIIRQVWGPGRRISRQRREDRQSRWESVTRFEPGVQQQVYEAVRSTQHLMGQWSPIEGPWGPQRPLTQEELQHTIELAGLPGGISSASTSVPKPTAFKPPRRS